LKNLTSILRIRIAMLSFAFLNRTRQLKFNKIVIKLNNKFSELENEFTILTRANKILKETINRL